jgi:hypothetical protein
MEEEQFELHINDIIDIVKIVDYACEQGAFKGWATIRSVLQVRDRVDAAATVAAKQQNQLSELNKTASELNESDADKIEG